jgi:phenylacetate-coenzyme A ligase PaaK-like adenylate-forming protein
VLRAADVGPRDRVALAYSFGPYIQFWASYEGGQDIGAMVIALGGMDSMQRLATLRQYEATALLCTPTGRRDPALRVRRAGPRGPRGPPRRARRHRARAHQVSRRYRTGDIVECHAGPCPTAHPGGWLPQGILGRSDDMVVIRGMNVFPSAVEQKLDGS